MGNGSNGGAQDGSQKGFALASGPNWAAGDRLTPQSVMKGMSVTPNIPTAPGTKVIAPDITSMPQAQSEVPSIAQSPLSILPQEPSDTFGPNTNKPNTNLVSQVPEGQNTSGILPTYSDWFGNPASKPGMIFSAQKTQPYTNSTIAQSPDQTTTQGANPVAFANASKIQSALPQVQSTQSGAPASNATPNVAQAPSQPNPTQTDNSVATTSNLDAKLPPGMRGLGPTFEKYGNQYGVDPALLASISMHETGKGTSKAFLQRNNAMGVSNNKGPISFANVEDSIAHQAKTLGTSSLYKSFRNSGNISDLGSVYAPIGEGNDPYSQNKDWVGGVSKFYNQMKGNT